MEKVRIVILLGVLSVAASTGQSQAHPWHRKALAEKYDAAVNCQACHLSRERAEKLPPEKLELYRLRSKSFYNDFGEKLVPLLRESTVAEQIDFHYRLRRRSGGVPATAAEIEAVKTLREQGEQELLEVLPKVEALRDPVTGKTYGELLRAGQLEGIKIRTEPRRMPSNR